MKSLSSALLGLVAVPVPPPAQHSARCSVRAGEGVGNGVGGEGRACRRRAALGRLLLMASLVAAMIAALSLIALESYAVGRGAGARAGEGVGPAGRAG
jgi:hypothetical protein